MRRKKLGLNAAYEEYLEMKKDNPKEADNYICLHIYELAKAIARKYQPFIVCQLTMDSICNTATNQFFRAIKNYDPEKASFVTYAYSSLKSIVSKVAASVGHSRKMKVGDSYAIPTSYDAINQTEAAVSVCHHISDIIDQIDVNPKYKMIFLYKYREFFPKSFKKNPQPIINTKVAKAFGVSCEVVSKALSAMRIAIKEYIEKETLPPPTSTPEGTD